jgi:hypothetical protein
LEDIGQLFGDSPHVAHIEHDNAAKDDEKATEYQVKSAVSS